jgi:hypothetical protein
VRAKLPVRFCPQCRTHLVPSTWWVVIATGADVCIFCAKRYHQGDGARPRTPEELGLIALRALSPLN